MIVDKRPGVWTLFLIKRGAISPSIMWCLLAKLLLAGAAVAAYE